jgi:hypothetical protein
MELYKWYKGDELPDRECDCVVVWNVPAALKRVFNLAETPAAKEIMRYTTNVHEGESMVFIDQTGDPLPNSMIIAWMPIEFPKEVS